uniref:Putative ATP-binding protein n=1 Tax=Candidatus Methanogaster sp. ANME-2c ERB4 TaxID=2759911 RepID=A0A7G9YNI5_9EURY|nr:putative ATP-binding protein [Methanosarcinales archaeon ANME-2c ERB4]
MKRIAFHDRERETDEIMDILDAEPSLITFVYGPINSGKTTMVSHLIKELPEDYAPFYVNLRGRFITDYEDFLNVLFEIDEEGEVSNVTEYVKSALKDLGAVSGIPIPINLFERIFEKKDKSKDMFKYIEQFFVEVSKTRTPILIIDELQVIGDLKIDGSLIYKLFNFFIRLTKELHLAHVFVITSDSLFIEQVYSEAMLEERCRYLLVDDFDRETTAEFLEGYGFTDDEVGVAWEYCGGKPVCLVELINRKFGGGDVKEKCADALKIRVSQLRDLLDLLGYVKPQVMLEEAKYDVEREHVVEIMKMLVDRDVVSFEGYRPEKQFMIKKNILFLDPKDGMVRPQSRLNLLAIREVMRDA